jgi:ATP-dependent helicase/nuclease subunit A
LSAKTFHIYRSSAGSGKTRTLAKAYLKLALGHRAHYFRHILAVTFTNKSTQEMKDRILAYLNDFSKGATNELAQELMAELGLDASTFIERSLETQRAILHHYNQFSISTIDAFFQQVIRAFTRESGLMGDYRLEVDQDAVMEEVINNLIDELGKDENLTSWVIDFARENLENDRAWDVRLSLLEFSREIFREEFKIIEDDLVEVTSERDFFKKLLVNLKSQKYEFINFVKKKSNEALQIIHEAQLGAADFKYGGGPYNWFVKFSNFNSVKFFDEKEKGSRPEKEFQLPDNWPDKSHSNKSAIASLAEVKLIPLMNEILDYRKHQYQRCLSAEVVLNNFYAFGLIADISRKLREYKNENNLMLLADAPKFLNGVIQESDTPFIYEKVGSFYKNFLIDEFQDTSGLQWKNFKPLVVNSLDQGNASFVVGDVKQAIYRWRGGDLNLLQNQIEKQIGSERVEVNVLNSNFRSASNLVTFNNHLFKSASSFIAAETGATIPVSAYEDIEQHHARPVQGFIRVKFIKDEKNWRDAAMALIPKHLEKLQDGGVPLKDIAILVRTNNEGQQIVAHLLHYKNSDEASPTCRYDVISNESLRIDGAASVNLLLGAMRYLHNPDDDIARAQLAFEYAKLHEPDRSLTEILAVTNQSVFESYLPEEFTRKKITLKKLPLFELTETLIQVFKLSNQLGELTYLQTFQELVLNFYTRERNDLNAFLEWWEENRHSDKTSIKTSGEIDAAQIITIHKSKGLQFKYVIIPFCSWELDHLPWKSPNLWVKSDAPIFKEAGYLPVKYSSGLSETYFNDSYQQERSYGFLDNLNLLYVAFTRAESGMIVTAPHPDGKGVKGTVAGIVHNSIASNIALLEKWNEVEQEWIDGEIRYVVDVKKAALRTVSLSSYPVTMWREKLVIRQAGKTFFEQVDNEVRDKINYGVHIHTVLSHIKHDHELDAALSYLTENGYVTNEELPQITEQIQTLLTNPIIASWFSPHWQVRTEVPILLPGGEENRIDRLMLDGAKAIIVDFKTGNPNKADQTQVLAYMDVLKKMNFTEVDGFILYLKSSEVVEVKKGTSKKVKRKKDDDQMELFG